MNLSKNKKAKTITSIAVFYDIIKPEIDHSSNVKYVDGDICYKTSIDKAIVGCEEVYDCAGVLGTHELVFQTERAIDTNRKAKEIDSGIQIILFLEEYEKET